MYYAGMGSDPRTNIRNQGLGSAQGMDRAQGNLGMAMGDQQAALGMYEQAAMGQGPSQAQALVQGMGDRNMAQQMQMQAQQRGGNTAQAARAATTAGLAAQGQTQQQLGAMAAQEQQAGMQGYAGLGSQMAGQALQQQGMYQNAMNQQLGMQLEDDIARRNAEQRAREARTQRNLGWANFGTNLGTGILEGVFGGVGG